MVRHTYPLAQGETFSGRLDQEINAHLLSIASTLPKAKRNWTWAQHAAAALKKYKGDEAKYQAALKRWEENGRTGKAPKAPAVDNLWSLIKPVYCKLQNGNCAFCERKLGKEEIAAYEQDMEHFRPKKGVNPWPPPAEKWPGKNPLGADIPTSPGEGEGYLALAWHPLNYIVACATCNQRCKKNFFPVSKKHDFSFADPAALIHTEHPYLIYPLGDVDDDPESIISFRGILAQAAHTDPGHEQDRALVTIALFLLNDPSTEDRLQEERAERLLLLAARLRDYEASPSQATWDEVRRVASPSSTHRACTSAMIRLYSRDRSEAWERLRDVQHYIQTNRPLPDNLPPLPSP